MDEGGEITCKEMGKEPPPLSQEPLVCLQTLPVLERGTGSACPLQLPRQKGGVQAPCRMGPHLSSSTSIQPLFRGTLPSLNPGVLVCLYYTLLPLGLEPGQPASSL